jgi:sodium/bile acid cotransporter 7
LLLMAVTLPSRQLAGAVLRPWPAAWAVAISYGLVPLLGCLGASLLPGADFRVGLMVSVSVPCTLASAVLYTRLAGGDEATTLLVVFLTTGSGWFMTPLLLGWSSGAEVAIDTQAMMLDLLCCLVLPVATGQGSRLTAAVAAFADRRKVPLGVVSQVLILLILYKAALAVAERLGADSVTVSGWSLLGVAGACVALHVVALGFGLITSWGLGFGRPQRIAVAFAGSQKTIPVGLLLLERYFAAFPLAVVPLACYQVGQLVFDLLIAERLASGLPGEPPLPADSGNHRWAP